MRGHRTRGIVDKKSQRRPFRFVRYLPAWSLSVVVFAAIVWLTLGKPPSPPDDFALWEHTDKIVHAFMFGSLFMAMCVDWYRGHTTRKPRYFSAPVAAFFGWACVAGALIELLQPHFGRTCDLYDFYADAVGVLAAWLLMPWFVGLLRGKA